MKLEKLNRGIIKANKKLCKVERKLEKEVKAKNASLRLKDIKLEVAKERRILYSRISKKLELTSEPYRALGESQFEKLSGSLDFKKYKESFSLVFNAINCFTGFMNVNGHFYCEGDFTLKTSILKIIEPLFAKYAYPSKMEGQIDYLGNVFVKVTKYKWSFFNTMPEEFVANVLRDGTITIQTTNRSNDFVRGHKGVVHKIISSLAFSTNEESQAFFRTREKLTELIEVERAKLQLA